jgi:hypothetical protein
VLVVTNHYVKYDDFVINTFQDNQQKIFVIMAPVTLTFDLVTPELKRVIY